MIGVGLVGYGYWGANLARTLKQAGAVIVAVSDLDDSRLQHARALYGDCHTTNRWHDIVENPTLDAVVIATPPSTHFDIADRSLTCGKHVLIEKPMTTSGGQARRLIDRAAAHRKTLIVDHTFLYAASVRWIRQRAMSGELGALQRYDSVRVGLAPSSIDVDALWDLAAHDVAILDYVFGRPPDHVSAVALNRNADGVVDDARVELTFGPSLSAHIHVGWRSPLKVRQTLLRGSILTVAFDDMEPENKIRLIASAASNDEPAEALFRRKAGDPVAPHADTRETLAAVADEFLDCIATGRRPLADGESGLRTVRILELATASLERGGAPVRVPDAAVV